MSRTLTATELTGLAAAHARTYLRFEVEAARDPFDPIVWNNLTPELVGYTLSTDIGAAVISGTFQVVRSPTAPTIRMSPLISDALDAGRRVRLWVTTWATGIPSSGDLRLVLDGEIDSVDAGDQVMTLHVRDRIGASLADRDIKSTFTLAADMDLGSDVMPQLLVWAGVGVGSGEKQIPLDAPVTGIETAESAEVGPVKLLEAVRSVAGRIGWQARPRWNDSASEFRLAFYEPDRAKSTADRVIPANRYIVLPTVKVDRTDVRNLIEVSFRNTSTGVRESAFSTDTHSSIAHYGERYGLIIEADSSPINTPALAGALAQAAYDDLSAADVEIDVDVLMLWPVDLDDIVELEANGEQFTSNQKLAVAGYSQSFGPQQERTRLRLRGRPSASLESWTRVGWRESIEGPDVPDPFGVLDVYLTPLRELFFHAHGNTGSESFRWAASSTVIPSTPTDLVNARAAVAVDADVIVPLGGVGTVAAWWYSEPSGVGIQGERVVATVRDPYVPPPHGHAVIPSAYAESGMLFVSLAPAHPDVTRVQAYLRRNSSPEDLNGSLHAGYLAWDHPATALSFFRTVADGTWYIAARGLVEGVPGPVTIITLEVSGGGGDDPGIPADTGRVILPNVHLQSSDTHRISWTYETNPSAPTPPEELLEIAVSINGDVFVPVGSPVTPWNTSHVDRLFDPCDPFGGGFGCEYTQFAYRLRHVTNPGGALISEQFVNRWDYASTGIL